MSLTYLIFFSVNYGWDADEFEDTSTRSGSCQQTNIECTCQSIKSCQWSQNIIQRASRLPRNHPTRRNFVKFIIDRSCSSGRLVDKVYCCSGGKGTFPRDCKLKQLKNPVQKSGPNPKPESNNQVSNQVRLFLATPSSTYDFKTLNIGFCEIETKKCITK